MEKLELKHIAPYLPYGLKLKTNYGWDTMFSINYEYGNINEGYEDFYDILEIKPILRPLSDLTEIFYWDNLQDGDCELDKERINEIKNSPRGHLKLYQSNYLFKHHFDIFGLIEKGLAIDINALNARI